MKTSHSRFTRFLTTGAIFLGVATFAYAAPIAPLGGEDVSAWPHKQLPRPPMRFGPVPGMMPPPFLLGMDLSEMQQDQIFDILYRQAPKERENQKLLEKSAEALRSLGNSEKYDEAKAKMLAQELGRAVGELALLRSRAESQIYSILTAEQRRKIDDFRPPHGIDPGPPALKLVPRP